MIELHIYTVVVSRRPSTPKEGASECIALDNVHQKASPTHGQWFHSNGRYLWPQKPYDDQFLLLMELFQEKNYQNLQMMICGELISVRL